VRLVDVVIEAETLSYLRVRRVAQYRLASANHDWNVRRVDVEPVEDLFCRPIVVEIEILKRVPVPRQEFLDAECRCALRRTNHDDVPDLVGD
jgi:hypothetical protein